MSGSPENPEGLTGTPIEGTAWSPPPRTHDNVQPEAKEAAAERRDRWAHRRGEPRLFVFVWTMYLFCATLLTLSAVSAAGMLTADMYRPAARVLMVSVAAGVVLLWPMFRLSQEAPRTARAGFAAAVQDYLIVMLPAQAVIWPQWSLADFPAGVVGALAANIGAWGLLAGALLANALSSASRGYSPAARAAWMAVFVVVALGGGVGALVDFGLDPRAGPGRWRPLWMLSPLSAVVEITAERPSTGRAGAVTGSHWAATGVVAAIGCGAWVVAWLRCTRRRAA